MADIIAKSNISPGGAEREVKKLEAILAGLSAAEVAFLDGAVAGTVAVGKAVVPTTGKVVDALDITALKVNGVAVGTTVASGTQAAKQADLDTALGNSATGTQIATAVNAIATAVNAIYDRLEAFKINSAT